MKVGAPEDAPLVVPEVTGVARDYTRQWRRVVPHGHTVTPLSPAAERLFILDGCRRNPTLFSGSSIIWANKGSTKEYIPLPSLVRIIRSEFLTRVH